MDYMPAYLSPAIRLLPRYTQVGRAGRRVGGVVGGVVGLVWRGGGNKRMSAGGNEATEARMEEAHDGDRLAEDDAYMNDQNP